MSEDYFSKLQQKLDVQKKGAAEKAERKNETLTFLEATVSRLRPRVEEFCNTLRTMGIRADATFGPRGIYFEIKYAQGGHQGCSLGWDTEMQQMEVSKTFTENGKGFRSRGHWFTPEKWSDDQFLDTMKTATDDAVLYADPHGGLAKP